MADPGANGVMKRTALDVTAPASANDIASPAFAVASGTNTLTVALSPVPSAYATGAVYRFQAANANTGAVTLNVNALGAKSITKVQGGITTALVANDIRVGQVVEVMYDGTQLQMLSQLGNSPSVGSVTGIVYASGGTPSAASANELGTPIYAGFTSGTDNDWTLSMSPSIAAYATGATYRCRYLNAAANSGACTVNINGIGAVSIKKQVGGGLSDLAAGDVTSGVYVELFYNNTYMVLVSLPGTQQTFTQFSGNSSVTVGTTYQNSDYKSRLVNITITGSGSGYVACDSSATPSTVVCSFAVASVGTFTIAVLPSYYFKVVNSTGSFTAGASTWL